MDINECENKKINMEVRSQLHAMTALPPQKEPLVPTE